MQKVQIQYSHLRQPDSGNRQGLLSLQKDHTLTRNVQLAVAVMSLQVMDAPFVFVYCPSSPHVYGGPSAFVMRTEMQLSLHRGRCNAVPGG